MASTDVGLTATAGLAFAEAVALLSGLEGVPAGLWGAVLAAILRLGLGFLETKYREYKARADVAIAEAELDAARLREEAEDLTDEVPPRPRQD